jgi:hypothetical protein
MTAILFIITALPIAAMIFLLQAQRMGRNPLRMDTPPLHWMVGPQARRSPHMGPRRIQWQTVMEIPMMIIMMTPALMLLYAVLVAMTGVPMLVEFGMIILSLYFLTLALDAVDICCRYDASEMWPTTWGRITYPVRRSLLLIRQSPDDLSHLYMYSVDRTRYFGDRVDAHQSHWRPPIRRMDPRRRWEEEVLVYYHPSDPETALLVPGVNWSTASVLLGISVALLIIPLLFVALRMT